MNTESAMRKAGEITQQSFFTNTELDQAIDGTSLALAYLEGRGQGWSLAITPLRLELEQFQRYKALRLDLANKAFKGLPQ